jgi:hypothetical protein
MTDRSLQNPDGTPGESLGETILDTFCAVAGTDGLFGWATFAVCYAYAFAQAGEDDNTAGAICKPIVPSTMRE